MEDNSTQSMVSRLASIVYEGSATNDSIFMVSKMTRNQEERIRSLETRINALINEDRKSRNQILWLVSALLVMAIARFLNIDLNQFKTLIGM